MRNLNKLDKELLSVVTLSEESKISCIAYIDNFAIAKKYFNRSGKTLVEFPFIKAVALEVNRNEILELLGKSWIKFITKEAGVMALMNVARNVLKIDKCGNGKD